MGSLAGTLEFCVESTEIVQNLVKIGGSNTDAVSDLPARLDVCTIKCHPYYVRDIRTLTVLHPRYPLQSAGNLGKFVHLQLHPYLIRTRSANFDQIPYYLRTVYAKFRPYSIRFDPQRPCVGVKGALECCNMTLLLVTEFTLNYCCNDH